MSDETTYLECEGCGTLLPIVNTPEGPCDACGGKLVERQMNEGFSTPIGVGFFSVFRLYEPWECGKDGYPFAWHHLDWRKGGIKDMVREQAGHRCIRCGHPYRVGESGIWENAPGDTSTQMERLIEAVEGEAIDTIQKHTKGVLWSPCDERCTHGGPFRWRGANERWNAQDEARDGMTAGEIIARHNVEVQAAWRILTVHHLNERKFDCRWHNLVSLCQRCHLTIQRKVEMNQVWPFEHSEWFKPYAAGFYAYSYLGEELGPDDVELRLDELLALERVA